jgi:hypothetical protein
MMDASHTIDIGIAVMDGPCAAMSAIRDAIAILDAIGQGGLFEALPESENERRRHVTGTTLLELLETRLRQTVGDDSGSVDCRCGGSICSREHVQGAKE